MTPEIKEMCVAGCKYYAHRETEHHKDCPKYNDSLTKVRNDQIEALNREVERCKSLLEKYSVWEAMLIEDDDLWWPYADRDAIRGDNYNFMMQLQAERNEILRQPLPTPPNNKP